METTVSIIIVHWNTPYHLRRLLSLLIKEVSFQIIVIDNNSKNNLSWIKTEFPSVTLIENIFNRGYASACNQGALQAIGEWLLFLNPDVEISSQKIEKMSLFATSHKLDAVSPTTSSSYQKPLPSWLSLLVEFTFLQKIIPLSFFQPKTLFGGCLLIRKDVFMKCNGWDERFFLWFEDSDLSKTLIDKGYRIGWINLQIKHAGGSSFHNMSEQLKRDIFFLSMEVYARKQFSLFGRLVCFFIKRQYSRRKLLPEIQSLISITVPNHKLNLLKLFLAQNEDFLKSLDELIVVSSGIKDELYSLRKKYPSIRFIAIDKNFGFAHTANIGFRVSTGQWLGTINDDTILNEDWLKKIMRQKKSSFGSLNPLIRNKSGDIESAGIDVFSKGKAVPKRSISTFSGQKTIMTDATNAAAVVYQKEALNKVGLYDERFGSYLEDIDLSIRLKKAGYKNAVILDSSIVHLGQSTSSDFGSKKEFSDFKNWILIIIKNWGIRKVIINFFPICVERLRNISGYLKSLFSIL